MIELLQTSWTVHGRLVIFNSGRYLMKLLQTLSSELV